MRRLILSIPRSTMLIIHTIVCSMAQKSLTRAEVEGKGSNRGQTSWARLNQQSSKPNCLIQRLTVRTLRMHTAPCTNDRQAGLLVLLDPNAPSHMRS